MRAMGLRELIVITTAAVLLLGGCGSGGEEGDGGVIPIGQTPPVTDPPNDPPPNDPPPNDPPPDDPPPPDTPPAHKNLFTPVSNAVWDETAVRKVLHAFAYGGQTTDAQIIAWADMAPEFAIEQILTFDEHNVRLSTPALGDTDGLAARGGTLRALAEFWKSDNPANGITPENRWQYDNTNATGSLHLLWRRAAVSRGLNPFRQKIGFWETNQHLAVSRAVVPRMPVLRYYDDIMEAHEQGLPYQQVMAVAASSAAIALQYGHRGNRFRNGVCDCNEDFAREYHQLFFGILGVANANYHESVTIKNTAKAFTDMAVYHDDITGAADFVDFGTFYHPNGPLEILGTMIGGTDASQRIAQMVEVSIQHSESRNNLPVMIIRDLADDNLDTAKINQIRAAWAAMNEKTLLTFLRGYAISTIFHDPDRVKYLSSIDRHIMLANLVGLNNREHYLDLYTPAYFDESVRPFFPTHNVFGAQTGLEAASSDLVFRNNFNLVAENVWRYRRANGNAYNQDWEKDWAAVIPTDTEGSYFVEDVAEWLWKRFIADGLKNFGSLERAQVYALLAEDLDFAYLLNPDDPDRIVTTTEASTDPTVVSLINQLARQLMGLDSPSSEIRRQANENIGMAINFIVGTPYIFAQEGR